MRSIQPPERRSSSLERVLDSFFLDVACCGWMFVDRQCVFCSEVPAGRGRVPAFGASEVRSGFGKFEVSSFFFG